MSDSTRVPQDLANLVPGPELGALLWSVDPLQHNQSQLADLIRAQYRQICAEQARLLSLVDAMARVQQDDPGPRPRTLADSRAGAELGRVLSLSGGAVRDLQAMACTSLSRAPALHTAMLAGDVDLPKLRMLAKELADLDDRDAVSVVNKVCPDLPTTTVGRLRHAVRRTVEHTAPAAARQRTRRSELRRAVRLTTLPGRSAALSGVHLPVEMATAAWDNIDTIARAASAAGDPLERSMDQLRADIYVGLLVGATPGSTCARTPHKTAVRRRRDGRMTHLRAADRQSSGARDHEDMSARQDRWAPGRPNPSRLRTKRTSQKRRKR